MTERRLEIGFGTTFVANGLPDRKNVVIVVEGEGWFISSRILESSTGKEYLVTGATGNSQDIQEILGQLSYEEVLALAEEGARQEGNELTLGEREMLKEYSQKKPI